ncbi:MAG: hypothetical protein QOH52_4337 [Pseudonocardiales bacterium]|nr:hypothetical protein [Pseudonocardiales bacterium]
MRQRTRQLLALLCGGGTVAAIQLPADAAGLGAVAGGCQVSANVTVNPGLTLSNRQFSYSYSGQLSGCFYTGNGAASGGLITAGRVITINGRDYQEPAPAGSGSCLVTSAAGYDFTRWNNGEQTIVKFAATSVGGVTTITGKVVPSLVLRAVNPAPDEPPSATFVTTMFSGQSVAGVVDFGAPDTSVCLTPRGLINATIVGALTHVGVGN